MSQAEHTAGAAPDVDASGRVALLAELAHALPAAALLASTEELKPYECDGLTAYRCLPWAVALPQS